MGSLSGVNTWRGFSLAIAGCAVLGGAPTLLLAQDDDSEDELILEEVIVTGTRIQRRDFASSSPISTMEKLTIEFSGQPTLEEALNQMPQIQPDYGRTSNNPGNGTSRINLRGLGAQRTLVMLNGRRLAPSGAGTAVDVNNLPRALIERVEIITGGASTVYGSDAVAGVVNFITINDFEGASFDTSYYITEQGDSEVFDFNAAYGHNFSNGRGNITAFIGYLDREPSFASDREITSVPFRDDLQGNLTESGSSAVPGGFLFAPAVDLGNGPVSARFDENGNLVPFQRPDDLYNFAPLNYLQVPLTRYTGGVFANYDLSDTLEAYTELTFTRNEAAQTLAPVPAGDFYAVNLDNPFLTDQVRDIAANQFFPAGPGQAAFGLFRRYEELGARIIDSRRDYLRLLGGVRGDLGDTWNFDAWVIYTDGDEQELLLNGGLASRISQGLLVDPGTGACFDPSNGCVPVNIFGPGKISPEAADFIRAQPFVNKTKREQKLASAFITGAPLDLWAGALDVALGLEWRSDSVDFIVDPAFISGDGVGYAADASISGEENVWEIYGEAVLPLLTNRTGARYLGLELGARYSDYDNAGSVDSWKVGMQWEPVDGIRFRSILQRSVRAPNLLEAFQEQLISQGSFTAADSTFDPCSASADPVARGNQDKCIQQGVPADQIGIYEATPFFLTNFYGGGNPNLIPEEANTFTLGVVFNLAAAPNWQVAIDYFDLEVEDTIGDIEARTICFDSANTGNLFCDNLRRDPITYNVIEVFEPTSNRGVSGVEGIDTQISYAADLPDWAGIGDNFSELRVNLIWTHTLSKTVQENPVTEPLECAGYFGWPCYLDLSGETFPKNRATTNFLYRSGALDANLTWRWIEGTDNGIPLASASVGIPDPVLQIPSIGSTSFFDLGLGYNFTEGFRAIFNISNLLDEDPQFVADQSFSNNVDTGLYDIFGRSYQLSLSLRF